MSNKNAGNKQQSSVPVKLVVGSLAGVLLVIAGFIFTQPPVGAAEVVVYKSPTCGCCAAWIDHLRENGYSVAVHDRQDMHPIKTEFGVPRRLQSCHTAKVNGYLIEGHVPAEDITRLLREKPQVAGLAVPGMPMGSPGMEGPRKDPYDVLTFQQDGETAVYASH